jgi:hypothetical protein
VAYAIGLAQALVVSINHAATVEPAQVEPAKNDEPVQPPRARFVSSVPVKSAKSDATSIRDITIPKGESPHVLQTLLVSGLTLGLGTAWYLVDDRNVLDWDKPSQKSRLTGESWRFDNNNFGMNFVLHPFFGASPYVFARDSHFTVPYAFLTSFSTSMMWEFIIEYNERVSINDVIVTPVAGLPIGEFAHKFGYFWSHRGSSGQRKSLGWTLAPWTQLAQLGCHPANAAHDNGETSSDELMWHEFYADYGVSSYRTSGDNNGLVQRLRAGGNLVSVPTYRSEGHLSRGFWNGEFSRLDVSIESGAKHVGVDIYADTILAGYIQQSLTFKGTGYSHVLGLSVGYRYFNSEAEGQDNRVSFVGFPGVATEFYASSGRARSEISFRAYPIFGAASSPAFQLYRNQSAIGRSKTILEREGYSYGWGFAGSLHARQQYGIFHSELSVLAESLWSEEGLDRDQDQVEDDTKTSDLAATLSLRSGILLPHSFNAGIEMSTRVRESSAGDIRQRLSRRSLGLWLGTRF